MRKVTRNELKNWFFSALESPERTPDVRLKDEGEVFEVEGMQGKFAFSSTIMHYCYAKGRITEDEMLEFMKVKQ